MGKLFYAIFIYNIKSLIYPPNYGNYRFSAEYRKEEKCFFMVEDLTGGFSIAFQESNFY